jgi:branched-chain amino acid transport system ATP-binding protein
MLKLSSISKRFGGLQVLQDVSLELPPRGIVGLIGPNGAGKTTVFNLITGLLAPDKGTIEFFGKPLTGMPPYRIARVGLVRTFQNGRIFRDMSVLENVLVAMAHQTAYSAANLFLPLRRFRSAERREQEIAHDLLFRMGLFEKAHRLAGELSFGDQRRVEIARALATNPKLLLLDEPAAGMNAVEKQQLMDEIVKLDENGVGIFIIEHDMRFIMGLCRHILVLNFGRVIAQGMPEEIRADPAVIEAYLGRDGESVTAGTGIVI